MPQSTKQEYVRPPSGYEEEKSEDAHTQQVDGFGSESPRIATDPSQTIGNTSGNSSHASPKHPHEPKPTDMTPKPTANRTGINASDIRNPHSSTMSPAISALQKHINFERNQADRIGEGPIYTDEEYLTHLPHIFAEIESGKLKRDLRRSEAVTVAIQSNTRERPVPVHSPRPKLHPLNSPRKDMFPHQGPNNAQKKGKFTRSPKHKKNGPAPSLPYDVDENRKGRAENLRRSTEKEMAKGHTHASGSNDPMTSSSHRSNAHHVGSSGVGGGRRHRDDNLGLDRPSRKDISGISGNQRGQGSVEKRGRRKRGGAGVDDDIEDEDEEEEEEEEEEGDGDGDGTAGMMFGNVGKKKKKASKAEEQRKRNAFYEKIRGATRDIKQVIRDQYGESESDDEHVLPGFKALTGIEEPDKPTPQQEEEKREADVVKQQVEEMFDLLERSQKDGVLLDMYSNRGPEDVEEKKLKMMEYKQQEENNELEMMKETVDGNFRAKEKRIKRVLTKFYGVLKKSMANMDQSPGGGGGQSKTATLTAAEEDTVMKLQVKVALLSSKLEKARKELGESRNSFEDEENVSGVQEFMKLIEEQKVEISNLKDELDDTKTKLEDTEDKRKEAEAMLHVATSQESKDSQMTMLRTTIKELRGQMELLTKERDDYEGRFQRKNQEVEIMHQKYGERMDEERNKYEMDMQRLRNENKRNELNMRRKVCDLRMRLNGDSGNPDLMDDDALMMPGKDDHIDMADIVVTITLKNRIEELKAQNKQLRKVCENVKSKLSDLRKVRKKEKRTGARSSTVATPKRSTRTRTLSKIPEGGASPKTTTRRSTQHSSTSDHHDVSSDEYSDEEIPEDADGDDEAEHGTESGESVEEMIQRLVRQRDHELKDTLGEKNQEIEDLKRELEELRAQLEASFSGGATIMVEPTASAEDNTNRTSTTSTLVVSPPARERRTDTKKRDSDSQQQTEAEKEAEKEAAKVQTEQETQRSHQRKSKPDHLSVDVSPPNSPRRRSSGSKRGSLISRRRSSYIDREEQMSGSEDISDAVSEDEKRLQTPLLPLEHHMSMEEIDQMLSSMDNEDANGEEQEREMDRGSGSGRGRRSRRSDQNGGAGDTIASEEGGRRGASRGFLASREGRSLQGTVQKQKLIISHLKEHCRQKDQEIKSVQKKLYSLKKKSDTSVTASPMISPSRASTALMTTVAKSPKRASNSIAFVTVNSKGEQVQGKALVQHENKMIVKLQKQVSEKDKKILALEKEISKLKMKKRKQHNDMETLNVKEMKEPTTIEEFAKQSHKLKHEISKLKRRIGWWRKRWTDKIQAEKQQTQRAMTAVGVESVGLDRETQHTGAGQAGTGPDANFYPASTTATSGAFHHMNFQHESLHQSVAGQSHAPAGHGGGHGGGQGGHGEPYESDPHRGHDERVGSMMTGYTQPHSGHSSNHSSRWATKPPISQKHGNNRATGHAPVHGSNYHHSNVAGGMGGGDIFGLNLIVSPRNHPNASMHPSGSQSARRNKKTRGMRGEARGFPSLQGHSYGARW